MPNLAEPLHDHGFRVRETLHVHALLRSHEVAEAARAELLRAGFSGDDVHTWADERAAAEHGAIRRGRVGIRIHCASDSEVRRAEQILDCYSARAMTYVTEVGLPD